MPDRCNESRMKKMVHPGSRRCQKKTGEGQYPAVSGGAAGAAGLLHSEGLIPQQLEGGSPEHQTVLPPPHHQPPYTALPALWQHPTQTALPLLEHYHTQWYYQEEIQMHQHYHQHWGQQHHRQ
ncbi:hypothetical protein GDO81_022617 [Engystomops pustulosus]|uniref:Uncharacterized protein n=1 Tax=Engystomops pustulosus TaxID=76066 RepID=A0AAV6Z867_ENGPU|nr:hypothetical protein GDO81_022617 [Engystomops pustulosus]